MSNTNEMMATKCWVILLLVGMFLGSSQFFATAEEEAITCKEDNFRCSDGKKCIPLRWKCDFVPDCVDASDEPDDCPPRTCSPGQFLCTTALKCIPLGWVCDGELDCGFGSVEADTSDEDARRCLKGHSCPKNYFHCKDNITCKPISVLCDDIADCPDWSDEGSFCSNKTMCDEILCEHKCLPSPYGPLCYCGEGKEPNGTQCVDTDECKIEGTCDQQCTNTRGSHICNCTTGYIQEGSRCYAVNVPEDQPATLIFSNAKDIQHIHLNGSMVDGDSQRQHPDTFAMDFDHRNQTACWINYMGTNSSLKCAQIYSLSVSWNIEPQHPFLLGTASQLALDWVSKNWYFLDDEREIIFVCNYTLQVCITLMDFGLSKPRGIALDPTQGLMFYTEWGTLAPMLEKARMDGTDRRVLVDYKIVYPYGVAVDYPNEHVYWVDTYLDYIERVDYNGVRRITVIKGTPVQNLYGITVFEHYLYVTSWRNHSIVRVNKYNHSDYTTIKGNLSRPFAIHIFHRQRQPDVNHPCSSNNGNCDHLCITLWKNKKPFAQCKCKPGFRLLSNTRCTRAKQTQFLLYGKGRPGMIKGINLSTMDKQQEVMVPITDLVRPTALDYDVSTQYIYYSDIHRFVVERQKIDGSSRELVIEKGLNGCEGLAVDWMGKNLYWTDEALHGIFVAKIADVNKRKLLIYGNMTHPRSIVVHPKIGYMYWSDWSVGHNFLAELHYGGKIERAGMDGSNREVLISSKLQWPNGLTIDYVGKKLYFCDAYLHKVERTNLDGLEREVLLEGDGLEHPYSLAVYNDYIYWTEFQKGKIQRAHLITKKIETLKFENPPVFELRLFNNASQTGSNPCSASDECEDLCLAAPEPRHYTCACRDGYSLTENGLLCEEAANYTDPTGCKENEFRCLKTHRCIDSRFLCDGDNDCSDGSDEDTSPGGRCEKMTCSVGSIRCDKNRCISSHWICDGDKDCVDGSDENPAHCKNNTCSPDHFTCEVSGRCIPHNWTCDLDLDCGEGDKSDEHADCEYPTCDVSEFQCGNKRCVSKELVCDTEDDCRDNSDEQNCPGICGSHQFQCPGDSGCLPVYLKCNTVWDCLDGSDEQNCSVSKISHVNDCHGDEFQCGDGSCIRNRWLCDLVYDCPGGEDEADCGNVVCQQQDVMCLDRSRCIYRGHLCDGVRDCLDGSDELDCSGSNTGICQYPNYLCANNSKCVNIEKVCDGNPDCEDGSDEGLLCEENLCHQNECSEICHKTPLGYQCSCMPGRKLLDDKVTCSDSKPCSAWGVCSQLCTSSKNSHKCECLHGYELEPDQFSCKSTDKSVPYIIFSNRHELRVFNLQTHTVKALISGLKNTVALDFFYSKNATMIFWTDVVDDRIYHGTLIGDSLTNIEIVVQTGLATAEGLAVDWIGENLYWVESNLDQIEVAKLNGSFRRTLIAGDMESPRAIALDPRDGLMFWTDWASGAPRIECSSMSGEGRKVIFSVNNITDGAWPNGITLDYVARRIYWIDAKSDSIHTARYDGSDHREVLRGHDYLNHPFAIALFGNYVYWTDWRAHVVVGANKWNGSDQVLIQKTITQPFDIQVMHPSRQPRDIKNPCGENNGGCSHLCLLSFKSTFMCLCPHVMMLSEDKKTCISNERVLLFSQPNEIRGVDLNAPYYHIIPPLHLPQVITASQIDFDFSDRKIYWADSQLNEVRRALLTGTIIETIIDTAIVQPSGLAIDWISKNMFIISHEVKGSSILACTLNGEFVTRILDKTLHAPKSLAVNPVTGKLYWSEHSASWHNVKEASMDGSNETVLTSQRHNERLNGPQSLAMDVADNKLYWVNVDSQTIQYYDLSRKAVKTLAIDSHITKPLALTIHENNLYYADHNNKSIYIINKYDGSNHRLFRNNTGEIFALKVYDTGIQTGTNPCSINNGGCLHLCLPKSSRERVCRCAIGFTPIDKDPTKCVGSSSFLLFSNDRGLQGIPMDPEDANTEVLAPISKVAHASSIDFVAEQDYIYWVDSDIGSISRVHRDGTDRSVIVKELESVEGLAIDWIAENVYWSDPSLDVIEVTQLNGSNRYVVVAENLDKPGALAVNPLNGYLFWADVGQFPRIERAALDGSNRIVLMNSSIQQVTDLSIDFQDSKLYWCDSQLASINRINFDGTNFEVVVRDEANLGPFAVSLLNDNLYWIDIVLNRGSIIRGHKNNASNYEVMKSGIIDSMKDILVYDIAKQEGAETNPCSTNNGNCEELCFYRGGNNYSCACAHGKVAADGKTCEDYDAFIMFSRVSRIDSIHMFDENNPNAPFESIKDSQYMRNVIGLAFDYASQKVFYSDIQRGSVNSVSFNGTNHIVVVEKQGSVEGLAYEKLHRMLYWTCNSDASINRISLSTRSSVVEKIIKLGVDDKPRGIAVDSCDSRMYWTNWNSRHPSIQRSYLNGFEMQNIVTTDIQMPNAITIDHKSQKLYWSDARHDKIERCNLDGTHRHVILTSEPHHPFDIAIYGDYIFWTDWVLHSVMRANKFTGEDVVRLRRDVPRPMGIIAVAKDADDCALNPCRILKAGCQDICNVLENETVACSCLPGRILLPDSKRCVAKVANCSDTEFECSIGVCIPYDLTCDGINECPDSSDEDLTYCATRQCRDGYYHCSNGYCVSKEKVCNEKNDCGDNSDEFNCSCTDAQFRCAHGMCISKEYRCDFDADCSDASDEMGCPPRNCTKSAIDDFQMTSSLTLINCNFTTACIHTDWICDGQNDCWDNSDEQDCVQTSSPGLNSTCPENAHRCKNGPCIPNSWVCDRDEDCSDSTNASVSSDELNCNYTCSADKFQCNDSSCIPKMWQCDGLPDCLDGSDENDDCQTRRCADSEFKCNKTGRCIPLSWVCDGDNDCADDEASDEHPSQGCSAQSCPADAFMCANSRCIFRGFYCDRDDDCGDKSDEPSTCVYHQCAEDQFQCKNKVACIPVDWLCNHINECGDNSDEDEDICDKNSTLSKCEAGHHECDNGVCIDEKHLCDGLNNCGDFSDERRCNINECASGTVCSHKCKDRIVGYECECYDGFRLRKDKKTCEDIDECKEQYPCSHYCRNTLGSYVCSCAKGYLPSNNGVGCKLNSSKPLTLIFSNRYYIRQVDFSGKDTRLLAFNLTNAVALDYDWQERCIYWSDVTALGSTLKRMCDGKPGHEILHSATVRNPDGLAVDWIGRNLYWCDKGTDTIEVSKLDGKYRKVLVRNGLQEPRAIVLDPFDGYLYWTDWGERPYIAKVGMDGTQKKVIVNDSLGWPNALTICYVTKELFWADAREDYIAVTDLNGNNRRIIISREVHHTLHHIFSLAVFEDYLFWTDWETKSVERCHKYSCRDRHRIATTVHRPMSIQVYHPERQPSLPNQNPCANNGGCLALCLLQPGGKDRTCGCPENYYLASDATTCISNCSRTQFVCTASYKCIPFWWRCDTQDDCGDGADEPPDCPSFSCTPGQFQCTNKNCIHPSHICDGISHCRDGSDEQNCDEYPCLSSQFKCSGNGSISARCISSSNRCDGHEDCPNKEDEMDCPPRTCPYNYFTCKNGNCIPNVWVCDKDNDCGDNSDELDTCKNRSCSENQLHCKSGRCIPLSWKCDGDHDCDEGEDEPPSCGVHHSCDPSYFNCQNHRCIPGRWRCDYDNDCGDNSDETGCKPRECSESEFRCTNGRCIRGSWRCNGEFNCEDHSDEVGCQFTCSPKEFQCKNPEFCIHIEWQCDGDTDCADGSDEAGCGTCKGDEFICKNGECIPSLWQCDGDYDCFDFSDEDTSLCGIRANLSCGHDQFLCPNTSCIPVSKICNGVNDCGDNADEAPQHCPCSVNLKCLNGQCVCDNTGDCGNNPDEPSCDNLPCRFGTCSQICFRKKSGNVTCSCGEGYELQKSKSKSCAALGKPPYLIVASENEMRLLNLSVPGTMQDILQNSHTVENKIGAMDVVFLDGNPVIFWTNHHSKSIMKYSTYSMESVNLHQRVKRQNAEYVVTGLQEPQGISVDWVGQRIYWIDTGDNTISFANLNGTERTTVIHSDKFDRLHDIAVEPELGKMFWTDWGNSKIEVANLDGTDRKKLVGTGIHWPAGITIDYFAKRIYWTDAKANTIETVTVDGKDRQLVKQFHDHGDKPYAIEVFEDYLYVSTYHTNSIYKLNKFGHGNATFLVQEFRRASDIVIVQENKQNRNLVNPCNSSSCGEGAICVARGSKHYSCLCPDGFTRVNASDPLNEKMPCTAVHATQTPHVCNMVCLNGGTCVIDSKSRPMCMCKDLYEGERCDIFRCSDYCKNRGFCEIDLLAVKVPGQKPPLKCSCPPEWTGSKCEIATKICKLNCRNGGTCKILKDKKGGRGGPHCVCPAGYTGQQCENCIAHKCFNDGVCTQTGEKSKCDCPAGYSGEHCEISACKNFCKSGTCSLNPNGVPICTCSPGYTGKTCEEYLCQNYCNNGGECRPSAKKTICNCPDGFTGTRCETSLCSCRNNGQCIPSKNSSVMICNCRPGFTGKQCESCDPEKCLNGGTCILWQGHITCSCAPGWTGAACKDRIDLCANYCFQGMCSLPDGHFPRCNCTRGWIGKRCENPDPCYHFCFNNGTCIPPLKDSVMKPSCLCPRGFVGMRCQTRVHIQQGSYSSSSISGSIITAAVVGAILVILVVAAVVFFKRRHRFNPFMHKRMQDSSNVEINNPMYMRGECEDDAAEPMEPAFTIDPDKATDFSNPVYDTLYSDGVAGASSEEKKGLLQGDNLKVENFDGHISDPLRDLGREAFA